jgi:hypothetical protein
MHLAYVERFLPLSATRDVNHLMYRVTRLTQNDRQRAAVIPVESIIGSVHLLISDLSALGDSKGLTD